MVGRLVAYIGLGVVVSGLLWFLAATRPAVGLLEAWLVADAIALVVTVRVARREGRRSVPWVLATAILGPFAWILMVATAPQLADVSGELTPE